MRVAVLLMSLLVAGCASSGEFDLVAVSGNVTMDGKPLAGAEVVFAPKAIKDQAAVGPASVGVTDSAGRYVLKTVGGLEGVMVGDHKVSVKMNTVSEAEISAKADEAFKENPNITRDELRDIKAEARRAMESKTPIPESYNRKTILSMSVKEATESANFDLKSDGSK